MLDFLNLIEGEEGERYRWLFALRGVNQMLNDFGLSLSKKAALVEQMRQSFFQEFHGNNKLTHQLNDKYRTIRHQLSNFLCPEANTAAAPEVAKILDTRSDALQTAYNKHVTTSRLSAVEDATLVQKLLPSYLHMFLNRLFISNQRLHELVVYHHLTKYYASALARMKQPPQL